MWLGRRGAGLDYFQLFNGDAGGSQFTTGTVRSYNSIKKSDRLKSQQKLLSSILWIIELKDSPLIQVLPTPGPWPTTGVQPVWNQAAWAKLRLHEWSFICAKLHSWEWRACIPAAGINWAVCVRLPLTCLCPPAPGWAAKLKRLGISALIQSFVQCRIHRGIPEWWLSNSEHFSESIMPLDEYATSALSYQLIESGNYS